MKGFAKQRLKPLETMRLNENLVVCPGCRLNVNPFIIRSVLNRNKKTKEVECPVCSQTFVIQFLDVWERGWRWVSINRVGKLIRGADTD